MPAPYVPSPIEATAMKVSDARHCVLVWAKTGSARIHVGEDRVAVGAGEAALVPRGWSFGVSAMPGSVVIPVELPTIGLRQPDSMVVCEVPESLSHRLIYEFALNLGYLKEDPGRSDFAARLLDAVAAVQHPRHGAAPWPRSKEAVAVADAIMSDPGEAPSLPTLAARAGIGERTLQRRFSHETGMTPSRWRTEVRLQVAAEHLREGREVEWTALRVGYSGTSGLNRAFRARFAVSPMRYRMIMRAPGSAPDQALRSADAVLHELEPTPIPSSETWARINGAHICVWAYLGTSVATIGGTRTVLHRGDVLELPAGEVVHVATEAGGLLLPLGFRWPGDGTDARDDGPLPAAAVNIAATFDDHLLHRMVTAYSPMIPMRRARSGCFEAGDHPHAHPIGSDRTDGVPPQRRAMIRKMTLARINLARGHSPRRIARELGYAHLSAFTRAFTNFHGIGPAGYRDGIVVKPHPEAPADRTNQGSTPNFLPSFSAVVNNFA